MDNLSFYVHSNHSCDMHMKLSFMFSNSVVLLLWLPQWFFFFLHVSIIWFVIPQFVQCLSIFLTLLSIFVDAANLVLCGTSNALLASIMVIPSSHNIAASLWCCSVGHFILIVAIPRYDYKPTLNIIVRKLFVVCTCKPWANFWIRS